MPPDHLYKYTLLRAPSEEQQPRFDALLTSPRLWFAAPSSFNDPMDCKPRFQLEGGSPGDREKFRRHTVMHMVKQEHPHARGDELIELVAGCLRKHPVIDPQFLEIAQSVLSNKVRNVGVLCLSECERDPVMFYHYGDKHHGMCLKFRSNDFFTHADAVQYGMDYPVVEFFDDEDNQGQFEKIFLTKYQGWSYEHEWRIVDFEQDPALRLRTYPSELLEGVIFGYKMPQEDRDRAIYLLRQRGHPVKLYEAKVNEAHYLLDIVPCGDVQPING